MPTTTLPDSTGASATVPLRPGLYRHFKGRNYEVLGVATHSETAEQLVVYRPCHGKRDLWVRPLAMFLEAVIVDGRAQPRFTALDDGT